LFEPHREFSTYYGRYVEFICLYVGLGAAIAGFVQGLSGFAFGMVAMSIWAWGLEPRLASLLAVFGALTGQLIAAATVRRGFDKKVLWPFVVGGLVGVPFGVWLVPRLDIAWLKAGVGALFVVWAPAMLLSNRLPAFRRASRIGDALSGTAGGLMAGVGFAGAIPTLWCTMRGFPRDTQRAIIQNFNLTMLAVAFGIHGLSGNIEASMLPLMGIVAVAVFVPVVLGARLYIGIREVTFRKIVLSLLTLSGIALLTSAVPELLKRG
jgi:uncharacterized membrane protein YfcA